MPRLSLNRRDLLRLAMYGGAAGALSAPFAVLAGDAGDLPLITRAIPSTGETLPVIGIGTNQWSAETPEEYAPIREVLQHMYRLGGTVIDTAQVYGRAEEVIGELFEETGLRDEYFLATKTPIRGEIPDPQLALETSFRQLRVELIDLLMVHNLHEFDLQWPVFEQAKEQGRLRYIGVSTSRHDQFPEMLERMRNYPLDFIQVNYSIDDRDAADEILDLAGEREIAVMINMPFGGRQGAANVFGRVADRELPDWAEEIDADSWAQVFLKYIVSHPAVTVAIPGTTRLRHVRDNQRAGRGRLPDADLRRRIERYWDSL